MRAMRRVGTAVARRVKAAIGRRVVHTHAIDHAAHDAQRSRRKHQPQDNAERRGDRSGAADLGHGLACPIVEPKAMRMPISRVRCATMLATRAKIPTALRRKASAALAPSSATWIRCLASVRARRSFIL